MRGAGQHIRGVRRFLGVVDEQIHLPLLQEFLEALQVLGGGFAAGGGGAEIPLGRFVGEAHIAEQVVRDLLGRRIRHIAMLGFELPHGFLDGVLALGPFREPVGEVLLLSGHDSAVGVRELLRHGVARVRGEPQMRIVALCGADRLRRGNRGDATFEVLR